MGIISHLAWLSTRLSLPWTILHRLRQVAYDILDRSLRAHITLTMSSTKLRVMQPFVASSGLRTAAARVLLDRCLKIVRSVGGGGMEVSCVGTKWGGGLLIHHARSSDCVQSRLGEML